MVRIHPAVPAHCRRASRLACRKLLGARAFDLQSSLPTLAARKNNMIARLAGGGEMTKPFEVTRAVCRLGTALAVIASVSFVCNARADDYPNRPITMVVPFAAGGGVRLACGGHPRTLAEDAYPAGANAQGVGACGRAGSGGRNQFAGA